MRSSIEIFAVLSMLWYLASGNQLHLVCKSVEGIFPEGGQNESTHSGIQLQGPRGERGIPGIRGRRGLPGPRGKPATVDYRRINDTIDEKLASVTKTTETAAENVAPTTATACSDEGLFYDGKCFTLPGYLTLYHMNHVAAMRECAKHGALLAEVHDRAQQDALINYIRSRNLRNGDAVEVWVGMQYHTATSTLLYRSGKQIQANRFRWWPSYPTSGGSSKYVALNVSPGDKGFYNAWMALPLQGAVCEKVI